MAENSLLTYDLLSNPAFVRDMRSFLELPADVLLAISELGDSPDGFTGHEQARALNNRFNIGVGKIMHDLRYAEYLYERFTELDMEVADAITEISLAASELEEPISIDDSHRMAIEAVLSFKRNYEISKATKGGLTSSAPHFIRANGSWTIKPVKIQPEETIMAPVLTMSIVWHDGAGGRHEAFFQMSDDDWELFSNEMTALSDNRKGLEALI